MLGDGKGTTKDHSIEECPQAPTLQAHGDIMRYHGDILARLEKHSERQTEALESIAEQGAMVKNHEKRLDRNDIVQDEAFKKIRIVDAKVDNVDGRVRDLELKAAEETGAEKVAVEKKKFWTAVKVQNSTPLLVLVFFVLWLLDKLDVFECIRSWFHTFKG